jgi:tetratricopeptide (TPR) repeat protein
MKKIAVIAGIAFLIFGVAQLSVKFFAERAQRQRDEDIAGFTEAIKLKPDSAEAYYGRGAARAFSHQYEEAIKDFAKAAELKPDLVSAYIGRGSAYALKGQYDEAIKDHTKALELGSDRAMGYDLRATDYYKKGLYAKAWDDIGMCRKNGGTPNADLIEQLAKASGHSG